MALQDFALPVSIPWKLIASSPDMMDTEFCNKTFPYRWRSSLAISAYEPKLETLPEELCEQRVTYLKITCSITGYQPSAGETTRAIAFPDLPTEDLQRLIEQYWGCYGVQLSVGVFPVGKIVRRAVTHHVDFGTTAPGTALANPYEIRGIRFATQRRAANAVVDWSPPGGDQAGELDLFDETEVTLPASWRVQARIAVTTVVREPESPGSRPTIGGLLYPIGARVTMNAYRGTALVGTQTVGAERDRVYDLAIDGFNIDRVVFETQGNTASLLEFTAQAWLDVPVGLDDYPRIVDFEPKMRDFYQAATEAGEILTASAAVVHTDKTLAHTETTETGLSLSGTVGYAAGESGGLFGSITGGLTHKWGETNQDVNTVQTDASRERRERFATTTSLSQLYNLLTGYHPGSNRAVFMLLPRPHVLQPTDRRTFVHGLRVIEGVQEFFLVVLRPQWLDAMCVETYLETGHFPEEVDEELTEVLPRTLVYSWVMPTTPVAQPQVCWGACDYREISPQGGHKIDAPVGWVFDRRQGGGTGVTLESNNSDPWLQRVSDGRAHLEHSVRLDGEKAVFITVMARPEASGPQIGTSYNRADLTFTLHLVEENPPKPDKKITTHFLLTSRGLCACFRSGGPCPEVLVFGEPAVEPFPEVEPVPPAEASPSTPPAGDRDATPTVPPVVSAPTFGTMATGAPAGATTVRAMPAPTTQETIVDERVIEVVGAAGRDAGDSRLPAMKHMLEKIRATMSTSWRMPSRRPRGAVGFLESDYFTKRFTRLLPEAARGTPVSRLGRLAPDIVERLGPARTLGEVLSLDLTQLARRTGLDLREAAALKGRLLRAADSVPEPRPQEQRPR
jgi:hypothetical protein